jgi:hypothetical protein
MKNVRSICSAAALCLGCGHALANPATVVFANNAHAGTSGRDAVPGMTGFQFTNFGKVYGSSGTRWVTAATITGTGTTTAYSLRDTDAATTRGRTISTAVSERGDATRATIVTDLTITGKAAQFGRGVMADVSKRLIDQFAGNLQTVIEHRKASAAPAAVPEAAEAGDDVAFLLGAAAVLRHLLLAVHQAAVDDEAFPPLSRWEWVAMEVPSWWLGVAGLRCVLLGMAQVSPSVPGIACS